MKFRRELLSNGLDVIAECNEEAYSIALGYFVKSGSMDETDSVAGVSHFLEHIAFKGSHTRSAEQINRELDNLGARANAFTSEEQTVFYASLLPELQGRAVEILSDLLNPAFRDDDFVTEKKVILEEISMYEDQPPFGADEKCREIFFQGHPLGQSILGTTESISNMTPEQMRSYFECRYAPENIVLVGCGNIDFDAFVRQAEFETQNWNSRAKNTLFPRKHSNAFGKRGFHLIHKPKATQQYVMQLVDGPSAQDEDRFAAALLTNILGDDIGSRLYWALLDNGLADSAGLNSVEYFDAGFLLTGLCCNADDAKSNVAIIEKIYAEATKKGFSEEELTRAKNKILSRIVLSSERPRGRLFGVGYNWLKNFEYMSVKDDLDKIKNVSLSDIHRVFERFPLTNPLTVVVGPIDNWQ